VLESVPSGDEVGDSEQDVKAPFPSTALEVLTQKVIVVLEPFAVTDPLNAAEVAVIVSALLVLTVGAEDSTKLKTLP